MKKVVLAPADEALVDAALEIAAESEAERFARDSAAVLATAVRQAMESVGVRRLRCGNHELWRRQSDLPWGSHEALLFDGADIEGIYEHPQPFCRGATVADVEIFLQICQFVMPQLRRKRRSLDERLTTAIAKIFGGNNR